MAVTQRSSARYRHWPFRCCSSPDKISYLKQIRQLALTRAQLGTDFDRAFAALRYGGIGINAWAGAAFLLPRAAWGAYPAHTYTDVQSGIGVVHNALMFDKPLKTVVSAPFRPFPRSVRHGELTPASRAAPVSRQSQMATRPRTSPARRQVPHERGRPSSVADFVIVTGQILMVDHSGPARGFHTRLCCPDPDGGVPKHGRWHQ
jgi:hypothetical protein